MKFEVDIVRKSTFTFTIEAETESEACDKAYNFYCKLVESRKINDYLTDEDLEYEVNKI